MSLDTRPYIFPRNLSRDYHGTAKPRQRLASIHRQKFREQTLQNPSVYNPEHHTYKVSDILTQSRRLDRDVIQERNQLISHSTNFRRVSKDTPQWWKSTFNYFKNSEMQAMTMNLRNTKNQNGDYDVFNRKRDSYMTIDNTRMEALYKNKSSFSENKSQRQSSVTDKIGYETGKSFNYNTLKEVTPKVGALSARDYTIKKPLLKIGKDNYIDTYSVF